MVLFIVAFHDKLAVHQVADPDPSGIANFLPKTGAVVSFWLQLECDQTLLRGIKTAKAIQPAPANAAP